MGGDEEAAPCDSGGTLHPRTTGKLPPGAARRERIRRDPTLLLAGFGSRKRGAPNSVLTDPANQMKLHVTLHTPLLRRPGGRDGLYGAGTILSFWNPYDALSATLENTYRGSLYLLVAGSTLGAAPGSAWPSALRTGYLHESNGLNRTSSRSWNRATLALEVGRLAHHPLCLELEGWYPFYVQKTDRSIPSWRGHGALRIWVQPLLASRGLGYEHLGLRGQLFVSATGRALTALELAFFARPTAGLPWLGDLPTLVVQYFVGRGEGLHRGGVDTHAIRVGVALLP
jgi:hypothetical protein